MKRTEKELEILKQEIIEHYFTYPGANSYNYISNKFNVDKNSIRKILTNELDRRFNKKQCIEEQGK